MYNSEELLNHNTKEKKCYYCSNCETNFITEINLKKCFFCNSELQDNLDKSNIKYNYIIPFKKSKTDFKSCPEDRGRLFLSKKL